MELKQLKTILDKHINDLSIKSAILKEITILSADTYSLYSTNLENLNAVEGQQEHGQTIPTIPDSSPDQDQVASQNIPSIGDYDDLGELGKGGMGSVRRVRDRRLNRRLAMKIIHPNLLSSGPSAARFVEEAQICAQLQHPNIVPVHEFGKLPDGRMYFTMKEIKGRSLDTVIKTVHSSVIDGRFYPTKEGWTFRRLIDAFHQVCQAVGYAHSKGIIHRDLKPQNIMLGEFGEVLVVDWGIAKIINVPDLASDDNAVVSSRYGSKYETRMGQVTGTPIYMAPEQARGEVDKINAQTDVYSLGAILYEILSGRVPYQGTSMKEILKKVKSGPPSSLDECDSLEPIVPTALKDHPQRPPRLNLPEELVKVCEKAMARRQANRYSSAEALGEVILSWLEGAKKREIALAIVDEAEELGKRSKLLSRDSERLFKEAEASLKEIPKWAGEDVKGHHWAKEVEGLLKLHESEQLELEIEFSLQSALSHREDLVEGHEALVKRYLSAHRSAESDRDEGGTIKSALRLQHHISALPEHNDLRHRAMHYLKGTGAISLNPSVEGVDIYLDEYVPYHRRLIPKRIAHLGQAPLVEHPIEMGSYRLVLKKEGYHDVIYPFQISRREYWDGQDVEGVQQPVHIPKQGEIRENECFIPGGWFWAGGDENAARSVGRRQLYLNNFVLSRFPVTNRDYLQFLNGLVDSGEEEEALKWVPRERVGRAGELGSMIYGRSESGRFILVTDADGDVWDPDWPVMMVSWDCAQAYCRWKTKVTGLSYRLPSEFEWEKSAKGVDGRWYVWGDGFDESYCCMADSHQGRRLPSVVDSFPVDESVYGVRGLAGNMSDWTSSHWFKNWGEDEDSSTRVFRGGSWYDFARFTRVSQRNLYEPSRRLSVVGFRVCRSI